eukprot:gene12954-8810_t
MFSLKDRGLGLITSELLFRVIMAATHQITAQQPRIREEAKGKLSSSGSDELFVVNLSSRAQHSRTAAGRSRTQRFSLGIRFEGKLCHLNAPWRDATIIISAVRAPAHAAHPDPGKLS